VPERKLKVRKRQQEKLIINVKKNFSEEEK
jgi:hypothetical protein